MPPSFEQWGASSSLGSTTAASAHRSIGRRQGHSTSAAGNDLVDQTAFAARLHCESVAFCSTLWRRGAELAEAYFSGNSEDSDDPFVDVVQQDPYAGERYIRLSMAFSASSSIVVCASCAVFLPVFWDQDAAFKKPLKWWLLVHCALQLLQIPVRIVFLWKVGHADIDDLEVCVSSFTASWAWRTFQSISHLGYAWFILGVVWLVNAGDAAQCTVIYRMALGAIVQAVARALVALVSFRLLLSGNQTEGRPVPPKASGAEPEQIDALPIVRFKGKLLMDEKASCAASCAICLSDYQRRELLRRLPCGHYFHRHCADQWLCRNKRCPLCMQPIDVN